METEVETGGRKAADKKVSLSSKLLTKIIGQSRCFSYWLTLFINIDARLNQEEFAESRSSLKTCVKLFLESMSRQHTEYCIKD